jgi:S1-C subfamily serine protease
MRRLVGAALLALAIVGTSLAAEPWPARATVRTSYRTGAVTQLGSGTVVARDAEGFTVLSCRHVLGAGGTLTVRAHDGTAYPAEVLKVSEAHDLSLLRVRAPGADVAVARLAAPGAALEGVTLTKSGYPGAATAAVVASGPCTGEVTRGERGQESWVVGAPSRPGDSGGGLYRESDRALVGVVWGGKGGQLWAVPTPYVRELLAAKD